MPLRGLCMYTCAQSVRQSLVPQCNSALTLSLMDLQEEHAIQTCQGLDSLAALDPEAEYKARVADSFTMHYRKVAEAASRKIFADLNEETSSKPQWVAVQKARYRTPTDAAGDDEDASGSE